jgi:hypothetical protein
LKLKTFQKIGEASAILEAIIYTSYFIVYDGLLVYQNANTSTVEKWDYLSKNYLTLSIIESS